MPSVPQKVLSCSLNTILLGVAEVFSSISKTLNTNIKLFWMMTFSIFRNRTVEIWPNLLSSAMKLRFFGEKKGEMVLGDGKK